MIKLENNDEKIEIKITFYLYCVIQYSFFSFFMFVFLTMLFAEINLRNGARVDKYNHHKMVRMCLLVEDALIVFIVL